VEGKGRGAGAGAGERSAVRKGDEGKDSDEEVKDAGGATLRSGFHTVRLESRWFIGRHKRAESTLERRKEAVYKAPLDEANPIIAGAKMLY